MESKLLRLKIFLCQVIAMIVTESWESKNIYVQILLYKWKRSQSIERENKICLDKQVFYLRKMINHYCV